MGARYEDEKERCLEVYNEEKLEVKRWRSQAKKEAKEKFGRKMN